MIKQFFTKTTLIHLSIYAVIVVVLSYLGLSYLDQKTLHGNEIEVPDLSGYHQTEVVDIAKSMNLEVAIIDSMYVPNVPKGNIISQTPIAGSKVKPGRKVYVTINAVTIPKVSLPNLIDLSLRQSLSLLASLDIEVGNLLYEPNICNNCVVRVERDSVELKPGTLVKKGSKVDLVLGAGLSGELTYNPVLIGKKYNELHTILRKRGLNLGAVTYEACSTASDSENAKVYMQTPDFKEVKMLNLGQMINVFLTSDSLAIPEVETDSLLRYVDPNSDATTESEQL